MFDEISCICRRIYVLGSQEVFCYDGYSTSRLRYFLAVINGSASFKTRISSSLAVLKLFEYLLALP